MASHLSRNDGRQTATVRPNDHDDLASLPDIGRVSIGWLRSVGIETTSELRRVRPGEAYGRCRYRFGSAVNRNLLYALAMGLQGRKYNSATQTEKRQLCEDAGIPFTRTRRRSQGTSGRL